MTRAVIVSILARYQRALPAYQQLARCVKDALPQCPPAVRERLVEAVETLLPVVGECLADLPAVADVVEDQREQLERLRRRQGPAVPAASVEEATAERVERLWLAVHKQASDLEDLACLVPKEHRPVHDRLTDVCRLMADRLRAWKSYDGE